MPWVVDGLSNDDFGVLLGLLSLAKSPNVQPALLTTVFGNQWPGDLNKHLLQSFQHTAGHNPGNFQQVVSLPWVVDGLNEEESAFLVALMRLASAYPGPEYEQLLRRYFAQTAEISLPLAGDVNIWVFQNTAFQSDDDVAADIADMVRTMEAFTMAPFPTSDIILLLVVPPLGRGYLVGGTNYLNSMWIPRYSDEILHIPHETAHYYFNRDPNWSSEGASDFMRSYIAYRQGTRTLDSWRQELLSGDKWQGCTSRDGIENILDFLYRYPRTLHASCSYALGEHLFLSMMEAIGEDSLGAALGELHLLGKSHRSLSEQQIYDTLLKHTPPASRAAFQDVYERLHGGPTILKTPDDHGDDRSSATPLSIGASTTGMLDYRSDLDFFSFQADGGQRYSVTIQHDSLPPGSLAMYSSSGDYLIRSVRSEVRQTPSGLELRWSPPSSGTYYVSVENFAGESGTYTLTITLA